VRNPSNVINTPELLSSTVENHKEKITEDNESGSEEEEDNSDANII